MKKFISLFLAVSMLLTPVKAFGQQDGLKEKADALAGLLTMYGAASVQYALIDGGEIVLSGGADALEISSGTPAFKEKMYGIGSVSKMYVAAAVMMLADNGAIDIDSPIINYMPDFTMNDIRYKEITPRMLLNHSSGLYGTHSKNSFLFNDDDTYAHDNLLNNLREQNLKADPGEFSVYTNDGFTLLEILVERVSGMTFTQFLSTYISEPLGLKKTKTPQDEFDRETLADTYTPYYNGVMPLDTVGIIGTGGIYSTAAELALFSDVLMGNREDILSAESAQAMQAEEFKNGLWVSETANNVAYGLGWDSVCLPPFDAYEITAAVKGGDTLLYHASLVVLPEYDMAMAVVSSGGSSAFGQLMAASILQEALLAKGIIDEIAPDRTGEAPTKQDIPDELLKYAGLYGSFISGANIYLQDGEMVAVIDVGGTDVVQVFTYTGGGEFKNADGSAVLSFDEHGGRVYLKISQILTLPGLGQIVQIYYDSQLLEQNPLEKNVYDKWEQRIDKRYYLINEKATSQIYILSNTSTTLPMDLENGYALNNKRITGEDSAVSAVQIPIMYGRDVSDLYFYTENGVEYFKSNEFLFMSGDGVYPIYGGETSTCTIQGDGYARWYMTNSESAGKTMTVDIPEGGAFAVYDNNFTCLNFSIVSGVNKVLLPEDGTIVFVGDPSDIFNITLK